jgi:hypothetical protein
MPRHVRSVDDGPDPVRSSAPAQLVDRECHRGRGGVVAEEQRAGSRADSGPDRLDDLFRTRNGKSNRRAHVSRAEVSADVLPREVECAVFEVGREDLVTGL